MKIDLYGEIRKWLLENPPVEDPQIETIEILPNYNIRVMGKSIAESGNHGQSFFTKLKYDFVDNKIRLYL